MSYNIRNIREISNDPLTKFVNQLSKKIFRSETKQQTEKLENKEDIYSDGQDIDVKLSFQNLVSTKYFDYNTEYVTPIEPDGDDLRLWIMGNSLGNTLHDYSSEEKTISLYGDPMLMDGTPFDLGIHTGGTKSTCLRFNRPTSTNQNQEYITVDHATRIRAIQDLNTGISFFMRFRIHDLSSQDGFNRTLFMKRDDTTALPIDGIRVQVGGNGNVIVRIRDGGAVYNNQTANGTIAINTVYDLWVTYTISGNVVKVYVNNVDKTLTDPGTYTTWGDPTTDLDWYLFKRGGSAETNGHVYGDLYDFRIYREKVVSAAEVGYMYTNKWTIADIPFGEVAVSNYSATFIPAPQQAYTTAGYTTTGYNT